MRKRSLSLFLAVVIIASLSFMVSAASADYLPDSPTVEELESLSIKTIDSETEPIEISPYKNENGTVSVSIKFIRQEITDHGNLQLYVTSATSKTPLFNSYLSPNTLETTINNIELDVDYSFFFTQQTGIDVYNCFGSFNVKSNSLEFQCSSMVFEETYKEPEGIETILNNVANLKTLGEGSLKLDDEYTRALAATTTESESNNTMSTANTLYNDTVMYGKIGYAGDIDWYKITAPQNGRLAFWLGSIPTGNDYNLYVYDATGNQIGYSNTTGSQELVTGISTDETQNRQFYVKVIGYNNSYNSTDSYKLKAKWYSDLEVENNNSSSGASEINNKTYVYGRLGGSLSNPSDNEDWFKIISSSSGSGTFSLTQIPSGSDFDLYIYSSNATTLLGSSKNTGNTSESVSVTVSANTTYYIKIKLYSGGNATDYYRLYSNLPSIELPTSGYEKPYFESNFNNLASYNNCYTFALAFWKNPTNSSNWGFDGVNPGYLINDPLTLSDIINYTSNDLKNLVKNKVNADLNTIANTTSVNYINEISESTAPQNGYYKVALVFDSTVAAGGDPLAGVDYHWYRQLPNGVFGHKRGTTNVSTVDASLSTIYKPSSANKTYPENTYTNPVYYFEIKNIPVIINASKSYDLYDNSSFTIRNNLTLDDFTNLYAGMEEDNALGIIGRPNYTSGSGFVRYHYILSSGSNVEILFAYNKFLNTNVLIYADLVNGGTREVLIANYYQSAEYLSLNEE